MKNLFLIVVCLLTGELLMAQNVGINTGAPTYPLTVAGNRNHAGIVQKSGAVEIGFYTDALAGTAYLQTYSNHNLDLAAGSGSSKIRIAYNTGYVGINIGGNATPTAQLDLLGTLRLRTGAAQGGLLTSDASGNATWKGPVSVRAGVYYSIKLNTDKKIIDLDSKTIESQPDLLNIVTDAFTAPVAGYYQVSGSLYGYCNEPTSRILIYIDKNGSADMAAAYDMQHDFPLTFPISGIISLQAGDKLTMSAKLSSGTCDITTGLSNYFCVGLLR